MVKDMIEWDRMLYDGLYQFIYEDDTELIETGRDVTDGKCREVWELIKAEYPQVKGYKLFCKCYRDAAEEYSAYIQRDERRYNRFWRKQM